MQPIQTTTDIFRNDQTIAFTATFLDTTATVAQKGLGIALFDVLDTALDLLNTTYATQSNLEAALNNSAKMRSVLGSDAGVYKKGVEPNLVKYWGAGTPLGCKIPRRVAIKYEGRVVAPDAVAKNVTLVFGGQAKVRVFKNGTYLGGGQMREPRVRGDLQGIENVRRNGGYVVLETSVVQNDLVEIYVVHNGEPWGGVIGKVIPGHGHAANWDTFRTKLQDAGVIGAGFLSSGSVTPRALPYLESADLDRGIGRIPTLTLDVVLNEEGDQNGYYLKNVGGQNQLVSNADSTLVVRSGRMVQFEGGFDDLARQTTNTLNNPSFETGDLTSWSQDAAYHTSRVVKGGLAHGVYRAELEVAKTGGDTHLHHYGLYQSIAVDASDGANWTTSAYVQAPAGRLVALRMVPIVNGNPQWGSTSDVRVNFVATGEVQRIQMTNRNLEPGDHTQWHIRVGLTYDNAHPLSVGDVVKIDAVQVEKKADATPFVVGTRSREEMYRRFTGRVISIAPQGRERATLTCLGFENLLEGVFDENYPDRLSYISNGFIDREWAGYPVYDTPAFDAWTLEAALAECCARAGIDATLLGRSAYTDSPTFGRWEFRKEATGEIVGGQRRFRARSLADDSQALFLQRNPHYGNTGALKKEYLPNDDAYLYGSRLSERLFDRVNELAGVYGYDFFFDVEGQATIASRNNPQAWRYASNNGDAAQKVNPSAIGGRYFRRTTKGSKSVNVGADTLNNHRLSVTSTTALQTAGNMTVEWVFTARNIGVARLNPVGKAYGGEFMVTMEGNGILSYYQGQSGGNIGPYQQYSLFNTLFTNGTRYHVAIVRDMATRTVKGYVNGILENTASWTDPAQDPVAGTLPWTFFNNYASAYAFDADMEYVRVWNTPRSASDIALNRERKLTRQSGLVGAWNFNGDLTDDSGHGHTAQAVNGAVAAYKALTGSAWTRQFTTTCSRIDLYTAVGAEVNTDGSTGLNGALLKTEVDVRNADGSWSAVPEGTKTFSTFLKNRTEAFFYDDAIRANGENLCQVPLFHLPFNEYRLTIHAEGLDLNDAGTEAVVRVNGIAVFERDPDESPYPETLSTLANMLDLKPESQEKDIRNQVIVVGQRKAAVTDSDKFQADNPNNPYTEYHVSVAADPFSVYDPDAANFVGGKRVSVIVDDKVTDSDYAKWLARTVLYRQNAPKLSATGNHTAIPVLDVRDPLRVSDGRAGDHLAHTVWVEGFKESWTRESATVSIDFTAYPELPSYTPREDVDIVGLFGSSPASRVSTSYQNLYGLSVTNPALPATMPVVTRSSLATTTNTFTLTAGGIPDDMVLSNSAPSSDNKPWQKYLVNHPYRQFWTVASSGTGTHSVTLDVQEGDGAAGVYDAAWYNLNTGYNIDFDTFVSRTGANTFYDPYTSEVGNLVSLRFDSLISGHYRVSLWATSDAGTYDFPVAWLTRPEADGLDEEAHWSYIEAGAGREFTWDGVDNVGLWNRYQSRDYARAMEGNFGDDPVLVGRGFYAWNDQSTDPKTQIGDHVADNYGDDGKPYYTSGRYSRFYVKVEAKSDRLMRTTGAATVYTVDSHTDRKTVITNPFYVFTHLPEPTQVAVQSFDWNPASGEWNEGTSTDGWVERIDGHANAEVAEARVRNGKPIKFKFLPQARRGKLFEDTVGASDPEKVSVKLARYAHLKINAFDQFWSFKGTPWEGSLHERNTPDNNPHNRDAKRLTSRMQSDDSYTVKFGSDEWLSGRDLTHYEWVFQPEMFEADFGGIREAIRYGDYEQLYSLPGYDARQGGGTARQDKAFINWAFLNYLFYLSANTLDRSGRRQHCINPKFIDKSKIVTSPWLKAQTHTATTVDGLGNTIPHPDYKPQYAIHYERAGADTHLVRSIFVRQWVEPRWKTSGTGGFLSGSPVDPTHDGTSGITDPYQLKYVQPLITDFDPVTGAFSGGANDPWAPVYKNKDSQAAQDFWESWSSANRQPLLPTGVADTQAVTAMGAWNFNRYGFDGWYHPVVSRDFHPYWRMPSMPDWATVNPGNTADNALAGVRGAHLYQIPASMWASQMRDISAQSNWFGFAYAHTREPANQFWRGARLETDVIAWAQQEPKNDRFQHVYDYVRQDTLNRFDHFRGVIGRSPLAKRTDISNYDSLTWWRASEERQAGSAPVAPSGEYLMNLGNYIDYIVAPVTRPQYREDRNYIHFTKDVEGWFDIRFRHEFVWYNSRYFPVDRNGGARYWEFKAEQTGVERTGPSLYDSGAWTGWKDDIPSTDWTNDPHLRWAELFGANGPEASRNRTHDDGRSTRPFLCGGYGTQADGTAIPAGRTAYEAHIFGGNNEAKKFFKRANFFTDLYPTHHLRLAVGPRVPETRSLVMNLTLPTRLSR